MDVMLVCIASIWPCYKKNKEKEGKKEEGCGQRGEMFVYVVPITIRLDVIGFEIDSQGNWGILGTIYEENVVQIGDGNEDSFVEMWLWQNGFFIESEDRENEWFSYDADILQESYFDRLTGRSRGVKDTHEGKFCRDEDGFGGGDGNWWNGDGNVARITESEIFEEDEGASVGW